MSRPRPSAVPSARGRAPRRPSRGKAPTPSGKRSPRPASAETGERVLRPGRRVTLTFRAMNLDGAGTATVAHQVIAVPFALPGEEAVVEVTAVSRRHAEGKIVSLLRKAPNVIAARCRHFGRCGGCQWQHLPYPAQLEAKTALVRDYLKSMIGLAPEAIRDAVGAAPWTYRNRIQATFAVRRDRLVAGYYALGDRAIINVQECPIQHTANLGILAAGRAVVEELDWPIYDPATGRGLVRGVIGQVGFSTGEAMLVLCTTREVPDRMAFVRAVRDRLDGLVSVMLSVQPKHSPELLGRLYLLWGRGFLEDEVAGVRLRLFPTASIPPNPGALQLWVDAIAQAGRLRAADTVFDATCEEGFLPLALAPRVAKVIGVAPDRDAMHRAWDNARGNDRDNCVFYTRDPAGVLRKLRAKDDRIDVVVFASRGRALGPDLLAAAHEAGVARLIATGHALPQLAADLAAAAAAGYRATEVYPVDLLPQTSHVHCAVGLSRDA